MHIFTKIQGSDDMETFTKNSITFTEKLRGRSIHENVIPTVCNLPNMLDKLESVQGDVSKLKQWEKRSFQAYRIDQIKLAILNATSETRRSLIKEHILNSDPNDLGASCIDIYLVAFVAENFEPGKKAFMEYVLDNGITDKLNSAQAIWQVGKGDGVYLGILNEDGSIKDWNFFAQWISGNSQLMNGKTLVHNKLVRDRIPEILEKSGKRYTSRILDNQEYLNELRKKVHEELDEYIHSKSQAETIAELVDVLDVIYALAEYHGVTIDEIEEIRKRKVEEKGSFKQKVYLMEIEV
jgi:predicted house-cleaning noncanonical NTP pyrophosphatase (MazG superfamily)